VNLTPKQKEVFTMVRIKIRDLPKDRKISKEEMKKVFGGTISINQPYSHSGYRLEGNPYEISDPSPPVPSSLSELFVSISECGVKKK
jgi:hypothetical protein